MISVIQVHFTATKDATTGKYYLEASDESAKVCKSETRVMAVSATNLTTNPTKPIELYYGIYHGQYTTDDPTKIFDYAPNNTGKTFVVPDDGKPVYFILKEHLGIKAREPRCSFPNSIQVDEYSVFVKFGHAGWEHKHAAEHNEFHVEC